jgi:hypothetical protein
LKFLLALIIFLFSLKTFSWHPIIKLEDNLLDTVQYNLKKCGELMKRKWIFWGDYVPPCSKGRKFFLRPDENDHFFIGKDEVALYLPDKSPVVFAHYVLDGKKLVKLFKSHDKAMIKNYCNDNKNICKKVRFETDD